MDARHKAGYRSDVWTLFHALGQGYSVFLIHPMNGPTLCLFPPNDSRPLAMFYLDLDRIQPLAERGLIRESDYEPGERGVMISTSIFEMMDEGWKLYREITDDFRVQAERFFDTMDLNERHD